MGTRVDDLPVVEDLAGVVDLVRRHPLLYLRYSEGPLPDAEAPQSCDYESGLLLPGLSVTSVSPEDWWTRPLEDWVARRICKYADLGDEEDRFPWLLTGKQVSLGPDHEPIVRAVEPVARIGRAALQQAATRYQERFDVGQDSTG